ncbi:2-succinyl-5-enolpyruvyl-6-hydroxy-3-cyclohexene-1-carboxylic-acid synthase [Hymenobacter sp. 5317J-9]|uniref:2-succinyl-5-enolpyruvyl-6-hydroxy-3- cyclohexene-1-carboxylic-acid synthase n=1 Tax=Hymenobacter sp. 5317J-9 TaxID=2932250 RepID=UPI001FD683B1|nr:2-succinyl-5-enolpyruvyl-6-hydroxy-3-cyclohexene-1-carboxylic-acid synthase [Hymenobacter sp. 5317J-9]UOQ99531.1 2-succinyl-5-enolpyruvyl-6-hydroxy-3-cyclohexene-1-carboxylic-acid synthase [Hymenobacter sp. 5317J-9]
MQAVYNIAEICARHGITDVVLSPGSRSAPLTLAFARHPAFAGKLRVVPDERAAAFIGLGIAQATRRPVVLVCTSGSAGLNYAPAVAEAFFQQVPLLVLTADRPPEWIDQLDGQTIRQQNLYGRHAKGAFDFPVDTTHADAKWHAERIVNEAINLASAYPAGPVQVNVPLREPFYPKAGEEARYEQDVKIIRDTDYPFPAGIPLPGALQDAKAAGRVLIVAGQHRADADLEVALRTLSAEHGFPVIADVIANVSGEQDLLHDEILNGSAAENPAYDFALHRHDVFLAGLSADEKAALQPDLLITFGQSLISKALKLFLRDAAPQQHWHVQASGPASDTFRRTTEIIRLEPATFFQALATAELPPADVPQQVGYAIQISANSTESGTPTGATHWLSSVPRGGWPAGLGDAWHKADAAATQLLGDFFARPMPEFNEFSAFRLSLNALPIYTALHLANSMAVRYANILGLPHGRHIEVFANRGTSGIDGCTSTAVGAALAQPGRPVVLLTGDVAFFYDRNAFWHNYPTPNLRVVLFNNHGGGIFRIIDGPRQQPELDEFFETRQGLTAENTARDFNLRYFPVSTFAELEAALPVFFAAETGAAILEVFTDSKTNAAFFERYRAAVKQAFS